MQLHTTIRSALQHPSVWAGFAGILGSLGSQLDKPYGLAAYVLAAACSVIAILIKTPVRKR